MSRRRLSFRLKPDEAAVVAPIEFWKATENLYRVMADTNPAEAQVWIEAADHVGTWIERTREKPK